MNKNDKMIDDLIAHLDKSISLGVGHVNVKIENESIMLEKIEHGMCRAYTHEGSG